MAPDIENSVHIYTVEPISGGEPKRRQPSNYLYTVEEAIDIIGPGKAQSLVLLAMCLCITAIMMENLGISYMIPAAKCDLQLDTVKIGILTGIISLGIMCTQHFWGFLSDLVGRRYVILYSLSLTLVFSFPFTFIQHFWTIVILRFFSGASMAGSFSIIYAYLGEFYADKGRSMAILVMSAWSGLIGAIIPLIGWVLIRQEFSLQITESFTMLPWRFQILVQFVPGIACLLLVKFLPETPKFLVSVHKENEALKTLQWMFVKNTGRPVAEFPVKNLKLPEVEVDNEKTYNKKSVKGFCYSIVHETCVLLKPPYIVLLLKCCFIQYAVYVIATGVGLWFPELSNRIAVTHESQMTVCEIIQGQSQKSVSNTTQFNSETCTTVVNDLTYISNIILGTLYAVGFLSIGYIMKIVQTTSIAGVCLVLSGLSGITLHWVNEDKWIMALFLCFLVFAGFSIAIVATTVVDLFPTHLRGMAMSIVILVGRTGTFTGANTMGLLLEQNCEATFLGLSGFIIVAGCIAWSLPRKLDSKVNPT